MMAMGICGSALSLGRAGRVACRTAMEQSPIEDGREMTT